MSELTIFFADMSQQLLCATCGDEFKKVDGTRCIREKVAPTDDDPFGEPAEFERVLWGTAKPLAGVRRQGVGVNDEFYEAPKTHYLCDSCNRPIKPGERCMAWSLWTGEMPTPRVWEHLYIE